MLFDDPAFHDAVRDQIAFVRRDLELGSVERQLLQKGGASDPETVKNALESLALVRTEHEARGAAGKALGYSLPANRVAFTVDGKPVSSGDTAGAWFSVEIGRSTKTP